MNLQENNSWSERIPKEIVINNEYEGMRIDYVVYDKQHKNMVIGIGFDIEENTVRHEDKWNSFVRRAIISKDEIVSTFHFFYNYKFYIDGRNESFHNPFLFAISKKRIYYMENGIRQINDLVWNEETDINLFLKLIYQHRDRMLKID
jgi:hypothetical protein